MTRLPAARATLLLSALLAGALAGGCAERERANPLDPENHETGGLIAGFNALAGNAQVEIRWTRLTQSGVLGYRLLRWRPGEAPSYVGDLYGANLAGAVDSGVVNGGTYIYKLVAPLVTGDSAVSPPDTATPGTRRVVALAAGLPGLVGLTPDLRDILYTAEASDAFEDMELDSVRGVLWLPLTLNNQVYRLNMDGSPAGPAVEIGGPADVSVSDLRGVGWIASPPGREVLPYGPDLSVTEPGQGMHAVGEPHVVEAGATDPVVWIGSEGGYVYRFTPTAVLLGSWHLGAPIVAIALDETLDRAYVATRTSAGDDLYRIETSDSTFTRIGSGFSSIADLAFDPGTSSLWVSDRGVRGIGGGRLARLSETGATLAALGSIEPFGITVAPGGSCWASDLRSNRLVEVSPSGTPLRWSTVIDIPYAVRMTGGSGSP